MKHKNKKDGCLSLQVAQYCFNNTITRSYLNQLEKCQDSIKKQKIRYPIEYF